MHFDACESCLGQLILEERLISLTGLFQDNINGLLFQVFGQLGSRGRKVSLFFFFLFFFLLFLLKEGFHVFFLFHSFTHLDSFVIFP